MFSVYLQYIDYFDWTVFYTVSQKQVSHPNHG